MGGDLTIYNIIVGDPYLLPLWFSMFPQADASTGCKSLNRPFC